MQSDTPLLTTGQAAKLCSVTRDTILKWIRKDRIRGIRTAGGHYRIDRREIDALINSQRTKKPVIRDIEHAGGPVRCWEHFSDGDAVKPECAECVVYKFRATRCFALSDMKYDTNHTRAFCETSCEECTYYRRVKGLPTKILVISPDKELQERLAAWAEESIELSFAGNAYEASTMITGCRPAFAVVDEELAGNEKGGLVASLSRDPRVPGLKIILIVSQRRRTGAGWTNDVAAVVSKPLSTRDIADVVSNFLLEAPITKDLKRRS